MSLATFDLEEKRLEKEIRNRKAKLVFIQLPEGLKLHGQRLTEIAEKAGAIAIVSADPCYGACDLATAEAERLGADLIVHYGHSKMLKQTVVSTLYFEAKAKISIKKAVKEALALLEPWEKIGLVTTLQHVHKLDEVRKALLEKGKIVVIGNAGKLKYAGQVIGCDYSNAQTISNEVDAFFFLGGGRFHALGVALATTKPTIVADPYEKKAFSIEREALKLLKKRWANIHEAKKAKYFGILIGLKIGQKRLDKALKLKMLVENAGKTAVLFALRDFTVDALMQFPTIDAFINTACPRLSLDDSSKFLKPLLTPREILVALGKLKWEDLCKKGWFEN